MDPQMDPQMGGPGREKERGGHRAGWVAQRGANRTSLSWVANRTAGDLWMWRDELTLF